MPVLRLTSCSRPHSSVFSFLFLDHNTRMLTVRLMLTLSKYEQRIFKHHVLQRVRIPQVDCL